MRSKRPISPSQPVVVGLDAMPSVGSAATAPTYSDSVFRTMFEQSPEAIVLVRVKDDVLVEVNDEWLRLTGFPRDEVLGRTAVQIGQWLDPIEREKALQPLKHGGRVVDTDVTMVMKDRMPRLVRMNATIVHTQGEAYILFYLRDVTAERLAREALLAGEKALETTNEKLNRQVKLYEMTESMARVGHWVAYPGDKRVHLSHGYAEIAHMPSGQGHIALADHLRRVVKEDRPKVQEALERMDGSIVEFRWQHDDGSTMWIRSRMHRQIENGVLKADIGVVQEITAERQALQAVGDQLAFIQRITSRAPGMVYEYQAWANGRRNFPFVSAAVEALFGVTPEQVRADPMALFNKIHRDDYPIMRRILKTSAQDLSPWQAEFRTEPQPGVVRWLYGNSTPLRQADGSVLSYGSVVDITPRKQAEAQIERLAFYDALTGLPNRRLLLDRLNKALASSSRRSTEGALLFIDLDNFKVLNDTLGHQMGDELLKQVAARLQTCVRNNDTVARLGGDEFVVMLEDLGTSTNEAATQAEGVGRKILQTLNEYYDLGGREHHSSPSVGITLFHHNEHTVDELLKRADLAMYQAKAAGRNTMRFFDPHMQAAASQRATLEADLRQALVRNEFVLYYQPVVNEVSTITGVEALVRWNHPERGLVFPGDFIAVAEQTGLIQPLGQWVLEAACAQLVAWAAHPRTERLTVAVNVSARQFRHPEFSGHLQALLERTGTNPFRLKLELTESLLLHDMEDAIAKMAELRAIGVGFSLDDFGTGYSSLAYLKRLPLDQLKIDRSFVSDVLEDPNDAAIARTILTLAQSLDLGVVAEGVETAGQHAFLLRAGCKAFQGYFFGRPVPVHALDLPRL
jgi:diguanylate cyclase (GGDEF)-like protein/PAS domain S-box-containing protein